ncbi:MAG: hypothetical protein AAGI22_23080 [Planctomycetota bacterium]
MTTALRISLAALLAPAALSQSALLREGDPAPAGSAGTMITFISNTAVNQSGGYAATIGTSGGGGTLSGVWGNLSGGTGGLLREETTIGNLTQTSFESFFGIAAAEVCYSASSDRAGGSTGLDGVWLDDTVIAIEEDPVPNTPNLFWTFASRPGATQGGVPYFIGGRSTTQGGSTQTRAIYFGVVPAPVYESGVTYPNMPAPLSTQAVDFDFRFSANGTNNITPLDLETTTADDGVIASNGVGLILGGTLVQESNVIPVSVGGIGDAWDNFDFCGITEAGDYFFTGDTDGDTSTDEFIVRNGVIALREGDTADGEVVSGSIEGAFVNESNELVVIWDIVDAGGGTIEAMLLEGEIVLREGDPVDWDGDGVIDPGVTITNFTGTSSVTIDANGAIYFTADCDVMGTTLEGYFRLGDGSIGTNYCSANPNSTGTTSKISAVGSASVADNSVTLFASDLPLNATTYFLTSMTQDFVMNPGGSQGNLCVGGAIGRYVGPGQVLNSGAAGEASLVLDLTQTPQPTGFVSIQPGETWNFQGWHRDSLMGSATSNFTDGLEILFQ